MIRSVFLKEFYKIRWLMLMVVLANAAVCVYVSVTTRRLFILDHPEVVWYRVLHLGQINYADVKYLPLLSGIAIAFIQYLPEMWQQRLRLSLHLPVPIQTLVFVHIWIGLAAFCTAMLPCALTLGWLTLHFFPAETLRTIFLTVLPWGFAGVAGYLGGTLVLLEPNLRLKAFNAVICAGVVGLYLQWAEPGQYTRILPQLVLPLGLLMFAVLVPAYRFRYRRMV